MSSPKNFWPVERFKNFPLDHRWNNNWPKKRIWNIEYLKLVEAITHIFREPQYRQQRAQLLDYCFQQGEFNNANTTDLSFFNNILAHDLAFFVGNQSREIIQDFPLDPNIYTPIAHLKASHFDLYEVHKTIPLNFITIKSLTQNKTYLVHAPFSAKIKKHDHIFARLMPLGFGLKISQPFLVFPNHYLNTTLEEINEKTKQISTKFPHFNTTTLLKTSAYQIYESIQAQHFHKYLINTTIEQNITLNPQNITYKFKDPRKIPNILLLSNATLVDKTNKDKIFTVKLIDNPNLDDDICKAIITIENKSVEILAFINENLSLITDHIQNANPFITQQTQLSQTETYRCLRHIFKDASENVF